MDVRTLNSDVITNVVLEDLVNTRDALGNYIYFLLKHCSIQQPIAVITLGKEIDGETLIGFILIICFCACEY